MQESTGEMALVRYVFIYYNFVLDQQRRIHLRFFQVSSSLDSFLPGTLSSLFPLFFQDAAVETLTKLNWPLVARRSSSDLFPAGQNIYESFH